MRWRSDADVPLLSACVLFALDPEDGPVGMGDVAEAIGISVDDAARALHELRSLGYARENGRQYELTEKGERLLAAFLSDLSEAERREFVAILGDPDWT